MTSPQTRLEALDRELDDLREGPPRELPRQTRSAGEIETELAELEREVASYRRTLDLPEREAAELCTRALAYVRGDAVEGPRTDQVPKLPEAPTAERAQSEKPEPKRAQSEKPKPKPKPKAPSFPPESILPPPIEAEPEAEVTPVSAPPAEHAEDLAPVTSLPPRPPHVSEAPASQLTAAQRALIEPRKIDNVDDVEELGLMMEPSLLQPPIRHESEPPFEEARDRTTSRPPIAAEPSEVEPRRHPSAAPTRVLDSEEERRPPLRLDDEDDDDGPYRGVRPERREEDIESDGPPSGDLTKGALEIDAFLGELEDTGRETAPPEAIPPNAAPSDDPVVEIEAAEELAEETPASAVEFEFFDGLAEPRESQPSPDRALEGQALFDAIEDSTTDIGESAKALEGELFVEEPPIVVRQGPAPSFSLPSVATDVEVDRALDSLDAFAQPGDRSADEELDAHLDFLGEEELTEVADSYGPSEAHSAATIRDPEPRADRATAQVTLPEANDDVTALDVPPTTDAPPSGEKSEKKKRGFLKKLFGGE